MHLLHKHYAFTLIELIVAIALVSVVLMLTMGAFTKVRLHATHQVNTKLVCTLLSNVYQQHKVLYGHYPKNLTAAEGHCFYFDDAFKVQALQQAIEGLMSIPKSIQKHNAQGALIALQDADNPGCFGCYIDDNGDGWTQISCTDLKPVGVVFVYQPFDNK